MAQRRDFLQALGMMGLGAPAIARILEPGLRSRSSSHSEAMLMCSRGEDWGKLILTPGWEKLVQTRNILDAVEAGANVCELDPRDSSVGYGGLPNERGVVQLDASIMYGPTHKCGSVAALENIKRACSVARLVMERTDHMMIVGAGALEFAKAHGFHEENLLTEEARIKWLEWKENLSDQDDWFPAAQRTHQKKERKRGTVNVLGMGFEGQVAGITTTSGLFGKIPGRVGDSPIIGAGLYVDNEVGAAGATGRGEELIRIVGCHLVVELMRQGNSPEEACRLAVDRILKKNPAKAKDVQVGFLALNKNGEYGAYCLQQGFTFARHDGSGNALFNAKSNF